MSAKECAKVLFENGYEIDDRKSVTFFLDFNGYRTDDDFLDEVEDYYMDLLDQETMRQIINR